VSLVQMVSIYLFRMFSVRAGLTSFSVSLGATRLRRYFGHDGPKVGGRISSVSWNVVVGCRDWAMGANMVVSCERLMQCVSCGRWILCYADAGNVVSF